jgi:hypothetical protein
VAGSLERGLATRPGRTLLWLGHRCDLPLGSTRSFQCRTNLLTAALPGLPGLLRLPHTSGREERLVGVARLAEV